MPEPLALSTAISICVNMPDVLAERFAIVLFPAEYRNQRGHRQMWDWFPLVFFPFKIVVLGTGMFYAIKWHRDQEKKDNKTDRP
ncbi:hypothetical protein ACQKKX_06970 [Neorhizobium sp. NPDC001467]|uniref:hypothetical protein n=1 Tax=Neorhizobium sp. NPDC001467 TaxID=3390595 RepID=UPI003D0297DF